MQTGATLKANGLVEIEHIADVSSRLIVNRPALKTRPEEVGALDRALPRGDDRRLGRAAAHGMMARDADHSRRATPDLQPRSPRCSPAKRETAADVDAAVAAIIDDVAERGDAALIEYTKPLRPGRR